MAEKRMFSKKIIDTDWFMDMPASTQNLYFHLSMRADDDGFVANPKRIIKLVGASDDDYKLLIAKKFVIVFESGICVITDWRINNYLRADRYTETTYKEEKNLLVLDEKGKYELGIPLGIPLVDPEYSLSCSKNNSIFNSNENNIQDIDNNIKSKRFIPPTLEQVKDYAKEKGREDLAEQFFNYFTADDDPKKHWIDSKGNKVKNWKGKFLTWISYGNDKGKEEQVSQKKEEISHYWNEKKLKEENGVELEREKKYVFALDVVKDVTNQELQNLLREFLIMRNNIRKPIITAKRMQDIMENLIKATTHDGIINEKEQIKIVKGLLEAKSDKEIFV